jgi:hypothetical protein
MSLHAPQGRRCRPHELVGMTDRVSNHALAWNYRVREFAQDGRCARLSRPRNPLRTALHGNLGGSIQNFTQGYKANSYDGRIARNC